MDIPNGWIAAIGVAGATAFAALWRLITALYNRVIASQDRLEEDYRDLKEEQRKDAERREDLILKVGELQGAEHLAEKVIQKINEAR